MRFPSFQGRLLTSQIIRWASTRLSLPEGKANQQHQMIQNRIWLRWQNHNADAVSEFLGQVSRNDSFVQDHFGCNVLFLGFRS